MSTGGLTERRWPGILLFNVQISNHVITVTDTFGLYAKQVVYLNKIGLDPLELEVKRVLSKTELQVGPVNAGITKIINPVTYSGGSLIAQEQPRTGPDQDYVLRNVYAEEPIIAIRTANVDRYGQYYTVDNPVPVQLSDGSVNIETVNANVSVQLSHKDNDPNPGDVHDSVQIGDGVDILGINPDGSINVVQTSETLKYTVINVPMTLANTDYVLSLPTEIRRFTLKIRDGAGTLKIYETPSGDSFTVARGASYYSGSVKNPSLSLTVQSSQPNCVLEAICWVVQP